MGGEARKRPREVQDARNVADHHDDAAKRKAKEARRAKREAGGEIATPSEDGASLSQKARRERMGKRLAAKTRKEAEASGAPLPARAEARESRGAAAAPDAPKASAPKTKRKRFLAGKVFGITAKGNEDDEVTGKAAAGDATFSDIKVLIESAGGAISSILHKRVFALVSTDRAAVRRTQRIRKALKYGVPIVSLAYLEACHAANQCLKPDGEYIVSVADAAPSDSSAAAEGDKRRAKLQKSAAAKPSKRVKASDLERADAPEPIVIELGCCCSCHDAGKPSCSWCEPHHASA